MGEGSLHIREIIYVLTNNLILVQEMVNASEADLQDGPLTCLAGLMEDRDNIRVFARYQKKFLKLLQVSEIVWNQNAFF